MVVEAPPGLVLVLALALKLVLALALELVLALAQEVALALALKNQYVLVKPTQALALVLVLVHSTGTT